MAKAVTHISVFLASPGDVDQERSIAFELLHEWNDVHGDSKSATLQLKTWRTFSCPETGARPQAIINTSVLDDCDIVIGVFWTRFGSPTGVAESGTEEEIRRSMASGKHVMLYFSDVPISPSKCDHEQYRRVQTFRHEFRNTGLVWNYASIEQFRKDLRKHLARAVQRLLTSLRSDSVTPPAGDASSIQIERNQGIAAHTINNVIYKESGKKGAKRGPVIGTIGSDMLRKNYISYLVRQYNEFLKIGRERFGDTRRVPFSHLSTRIIQVFKAPANALPLIRFEEVADFAKEYVDDTIVGRNNRRQRIPSYQSFEAFSAEQLAKKPRRPRKVS